MELTALRRLTLRMGIDQVSTFNCGLLLAALSTIASSVFCEFVFELGGPPPRLEKQSLGVGTFGHGLMDSLRSGL